MNSGTVHGQTVLYRTPRKEPRPTLGRELGDPRSDESRMEAPKARASLTIYDRAKTKR
jgi:hypothetical protein